MTVAAITAVHNVPGEVVLSVHVLIFFLQPCGEITNPIYRLENRGSDRLNNLSKAVLVRSGTEKIQTQICLTSEGVLSNLYETLSIHRVA